MDDLMTTDACTLPTVQRPLRLAEFEALFRESVVAVEREENSIRLTLRGSLGLRDRVLDLTHRESQCCSFFDFSVDGDDDGVVLVIAVPPAQADILDALSARAVELSA
jgi:hypothetical protein